MKEIYSKSKDCAWLAYQLKNQMGDYVSFNTFGLNNRILNGVYCKNGFGRGIVYSKEDVGFYIKYCKDEFLRIQMDLSCNRNEDIELAMLELIKALSSIKQGDKLIGLPLAIYKTGDALSAEYAFNNIEEVIESLKNNTMFDDGNVEKLHFLKTCNNCVYCSSVLEVESRKETLFCTNVGYDIHTPDNETCIDHKLKDGEIPDIKSLVKKTIF